MAILIPRTGILKNLSWDCQSNGLTGTNNKFIIRVGGLHASATSAAPNLTDAFTVSLDEGQTSGTGLPWNFAVSAGQRVAVFVHAKGGTNISRLRVSFELEAERDSVVWQPVDLVTSMLAPTGVAVIPMDTGELTGKGHDYYFRVAASDGTDWTKASNQLHFNPPEDTCCGIRISWNPVFGATKYRVYRALTIYGEYKYIETSDTSYDYVGDSVFKVTGSPPEVTTAYINKLSAEGANWIMGGDVGIGTTTPQAKLDVRGAIKITDGTEGVGKILTSDAKGYGTWTPLPTLGQTLKHDGTGWQADQAQQEGAHHYVIYSNSTATSYFRGSVGIGTSTPQGELEVKGSVQVTGTTGSVNFIRLDSTANPGGSVWCLGSSVLAAGTFSILNAMNNTSGMAALSILPDGNVGIGTSIPQAKLDVAGTISGFGIVPIGSIIAWHKSLPGMPGLPDGWVECNGEKLNDAASRFHNQMIPNLNQAGKFLRGSDISGAMQVDAFQGHHHIVENGADSSYYPGGTFQMTVGTNSHNAGRVQAPASDGKNGEPRIANETRPSNMSVVWIMRVK
ncbi:MAG: putative membrane-anchored cell surface protein [Bacteroidetes bacterium]|nr:MAG: putative membrane-anchored cell surface protein [Bacteroidota bacterium]